MEFRNGKFVVPAHLVPAMKALETYRMTYAEAVQTINGQLQRDFLNGHAASVIRDHFGSSR